jgi:dTDP-4-amino-4,6-dideoxygalactose transaminase
MSEKIRLCKPHLVDKQSIVSLLEEVLENGHLVQGKYVAQFEQEIATYLGVKHAIAVSSGTAALHLALFALGIGPSDEVVVPAYTFPATVNVVELLRAKPILVDVDVDTYNILVDQLEKVITSNTKAIVPVHLFGNPADMDPIMEIARKHNFRVVEDAAGALGSTYKGKMCGTIGDLGCFSFHPRKIITTGEGGMVVTNDDELAEQVRSLRNHGMLSPGSHGSQPDFIAAGFNYRMSELEAVLGLVQARQIHETLNQRNKLAKFYTDRLGNIPSLALQKTLPNCNFARQAFVLRLLNKDLHYTLHYLQKAGIEANIGTYAVHLLNFYSRKYGFKPFDYPNALELYRKAVALPFYVEMSLQTLDRVVRILVEAIDENSST